MDNLEVWKIRVPTDMPIVQIAMLQGTIRSAWRDYDGDPEDTEAFWKFLTERHDHV